MGDDYGDASTLSSTSQNGWPANADPSKIDVITVAIPLSNGKKKNLQVARKAAPQLVAMVQWWDANIEPVTMLGGYNYRNIRGSTTTTSNHGSGTAIDLNWDKHPLGAEPGKDGLTDAQRTAISAKAAELGLRWGGNYRSRKDSMHVELTGTGIKQIASDAADRAVGTATSPITYILGASILGFLVWRKHRGLPPVPPAVTRALGVS